MRWENTHELKIPMNWEYSITVTKSLDLNFISLF